MNDDAMDFFAIMGMWLMLALAAALASHMPDFLNGVVVGWLFLMGAYGTYRVLKASSEREGAA